MQVLKYIGIGLGGLVLLGILAFGAIMLMMYMSSKRAFTMIDILQREFPVGASVESLIDRAQELQINEIYLNVGSNPAEIFADSSSPISRLERANLDFQVVKERLQATPSGRITLLARGPMIQRHLISIDFENRKVTAAKTHTVD